MSKSAIIHPIDMFCTPITVLETSNWLDKKDKLLALTKNKKKIGDVGYDECFSDYHTESVERNYVKEFTTILADDFFEFGKYFINKNPRFNDLIIDTVWTQTYTKTQGMPSHTHGYGLISGVLYADFDETHEGTVFQSPINDPYMGGTMTWTPPVKEGDMVLFPSNLIHYSRASQSDVERTIIAFNIVLPQA